MYKDIDNMVFSGGGVLGIAYLGALDYMYGKGLINNLQRAAGTSAGAVTACILSFNLSFQEMKEIADSLDFRKIPYSPDEEILKYIPKELKSRIEGVLGDIDCLYRLISRYGWYSTDYLYEWIKSVISRQFDRSKKDPPYTFSDFRNREIHIGKRQFLDLYIMGTNLSEGRAQVFSYETAADMEVAEAVRISMSIPLFFAAETIQDSSVASGRNVSIFSDGGVMNNYPINIFDIPAFNKGVQGANPNTLGLCFKGKFEYKKIDNLLEFIERLFVSSMKVQQDMFYNSFEDIRRSIIINSGDVSSVNFNVQAGDDTYNYLYKQGYDAAAEYFGSMRIMSHRSRPWNRFLKFYK